MSIREEVFYVTVFFRDDKRMACLNRGFSDRPLAWPVLFWIENDLNPAV